MKLERYDSYKNSGISWLGEIPEDWSVFRNKDKAKIVDCKNRTPEQFLEGQYFVVRTSNVRNGKLNYKDALYTDKKHFIEWTRRGIPKSNSILFTREAPLGEVCLVPIEKELCLGQRMMNFNFKNQNSRYMLYYFLSYSFVENLKKISSGSTVKHLRVPQVYDIELLIAPENIQNKIVEYLDAKTSKIDKEISILEQKIEKYEELKQTLIAETVLRGLNQDVELKNSEIEWIGDIPKHWKIKRLKDFIKFTIGGEVIDVSYWYDGTELTYTAGKNPVLSTFNNFPDRKRTKQNDILIARNGDGFIHVPKLNSIFTNVVQLVRLSKKVDVKFIFYSLENIKYQINKTSNGDFIASLNKEMWFNSFIITPKYDEQVEIANYLDEKTSKIDSIVEAIGKKIEVLKEFRKTLINDVVTGKVKVA